MHTPAAAILLTAATLAPATLAASAEYTGINAHKRHTGLGTHECRHCRLLEHQQHANPADPARKYNPTTGADRRNYPPDRPADIHHMHLDLTIVDMNNPTFTATQTLDLTATAKPLSLLTLDAVDLDINAVKGTLLAKVNLRNPPEVASFQHDGEHLAVRFNPPLPPNLPYQLDIDYTAADPADGLFWTLHSDPWPDRPAQIHTQGQPETSSWWFPVHDFPNERLTASFSITAPMSFMVSANGTLSSKRPAQDLAAHHTWNYELNQDHPPYLTSLVVGRFAEVDVAPDNARVRMPVWAPPEWKDDILPTYDNTHPMLEVFEQRFDEPYPWGDRYAQIVVWNFGAGGMENTTATTMFDTAVLDPIARRESDLDGLIAHELAHQWFGDQLTCNSWAHIWLNEGWATYSEALWFEQRDGYQRGYLKDLFGAMRDLPKRDFLAPDTTHIRPAMVSNVYEHPWEVFRRAANPYPKGAAVLHMLRVKLGDETFFRAVAEYLDRYKHKTVETDQFRRVLEDVSGLSLEHFFDQWVHRPGTPRLEVAADWDPATNQLFLNINQTQRIDELNPAFAFDLPVHIFDPETGVPQRVSIPVSRRSHERAFQLDREPAALLIDPNLTVLADVRLDLPERMLINQLRSFEPDLRTTLPARIEAARALRNHNSPASRDALTRTLQGLEDILGRPTPDHHHAVRAAAAESLGRMAQTETLDRSFRLLASRDDEPRVLAAIATALQHCPPDEPRLIELATFALDNTRSYAARANIMETLGHHATTKARPETRTLFERALETDSQHETVRRGTLRGLAECNHPDGLELAIPFTRKGHLSRLRPEAINTVAALSHHDPEKAARAIAPLLYDREEARTVAASINALSRIEHDHALDALTTFPTAARHPVHAQLAENARDQLAATLAGEQTDAEVRESIQRLERQLREFREQIDAVGDR